MEGGVLPRETYALLHLGEGGAHSHGSAGEDGEEGGGLHVDGWESEGFEGWKFGMVGDVVRRLG
jgi:hypothetical protein